MYNVHGFGASPVPGITTVSRCKEACMLDMSCAAVDYDPGNAKRLFCWLLGKDRFTRIGPSPGITHYILDRNCTGICYVTSSQLMSNLPFYCV